MKQSLRDTLNDLDEIEFKELRHSLALAALCKDTMNKHGLSELEFGAMIRVSGNKIREVLSGSYRFDLDTLARIDVARETLEQKKVKEEMERTIEFPSYKDSK